MIIKFVYKFCLIFLVTITVNIFGEQPTKRFGCHNFSSVDQIANMKNDNNNELLRNLMQCMRDTRTYNEENFETAKKLQSDFEFAEKDTGYNLWKKRLASKWGVSSLFVGGILYGVVVVALTGGNLKWGGIAGGTSVIGSTLLVAYNDKQAQLVDIQKKERKKAIALDIKKFVDMLQKKNK